MTAAYRSSAVATGTSGADPVVDISGMGIQDGDFLIGYGICSSGATLTKPGDFTLHPSSVSTEAPLCYLAVPDADALPSSYTFVTSGGLTGAVCRIVAYSGVNLDNPIDDVDGIKNTNQTLVIPSVDAVAAGNRLVQMAAKLSVVTWTPPGTATERVDATQSAVGDEVVGAGATGTRSWQASGAGGNGAAYSVLLNPINHDVSATRSQTVAFTAEAVVNTDANATRSQIVTFTAEATVNTDAEPNDLDIGVAFTAEAVVESALDASAGLGVSIGFTAEANVGQTAEATRTQNINFSAAASVTHGGTGSLSDIARFRAAYALGIEEPELSTYDMGWLLREYWGRRAGIVGDLSTYSVYDIISVHFPGSHYIRDVI